MELAIGARSVLRLLLTLLMLYSHIAAEQIPGSDMGETLVDDEDVNVGKVGAHVLFTVKMSSEVNLNDGCSSEKFKDAMKTQVKAKLITAIGDDCTCGSTKSIIINSDKIMCESDSVVQYSGQISEWNSTTYTITQLSEFIKSWRAVIAYRDEINTIMFNVTNTITFNVTSIIEEFGSGDGMGGPGDNGDFTGSGDILTIDMTIPGDDNNGLGNVGGLDGESGELRVQVVGYMVTLCTAFAILVSFV